MSESKGKQSLRISFVMVGVSLVALVAVYASVTITAAVASERTDTASRG